LLNEFLDRAGDILHRYVGIDTVLVKQVDIVRLQALQHPLGRGPDVIGAAVLATQPLSGQRVDVMAELGGDHDVFAEWRQRFANEFLVAEGSIIFRCVEERDASLDGRADDGNHALPVRGLSVGVGHAHASEADGGDLEAAAAKLTLLH
jgi:hypothetical protein